MSSPKDTIGASCPSGGDFYVCSGADTPFIGCCTVNPCKSGNGGTCEKSDLRPASFDKTKYDKIKPQACDSSSSGLWYTCSASSPPFMGCCQVNPCSPDGCPTESLGVAILSGDEDNAQVFLGKASESASSTSVSSATSTSVSSTHSASSKTSSTATATSSSDSNGSGSSALSKGAVGGLAAGVSIGALLLLGIIVFYCMRRRNRNKNTSAGNGYEPYAGSSQQYQESKLSSPYSPEFTPYNYPTLPYNQSPAQAQMHSPSQAAMFQASPSPGYSPASTSAWVSPESAQHQQFMPASPFMAELPAGVTAGSAPGQSQKYSTASHLGYKGLGIQSKVPSSMAHPEYVELEDSSHRRG